VNTSLSSRAIRRILRLHSRNHRIVRYRCNLPDDLGPDRFGEMVSFTHGNQERSRSSDDAVPVVVIEIFHVAETRWTLEHDGQPVDGDALRDRFISRLYDASPAAVGAIPRNVDDSANRLDAR